MSVDTARIQLHLAAKYSQTSFVRRVRRHFLSVFDASPRVAVSAGIRSAASEYLQNSIRSFMYVRNSRLFGAEQLQGFAVQAEELLTDEFLELYARVLFVSDPSMEPEFASPGAHETFLNYVAFVRELVRHPPADATDSSTIDSGALLRDLVEICVVLGSDFSTIRNWSLWSMQFVEQIVASASADESEIGLLRSLSLRSIDGNRPVVGENEKFVDIGEVPPLIDVESGLLEGGDEVDGSVSRSPNTSGSGPGSGSGSGASGSEWTGTDFSDTDPDEDGGEGEVEVEVEDDSKSGLSNGDGGGDGRGGKRRRRRRRRKKRKKRVSVEIRVEEDGEGSVDADADANTNADADADARAGEVTDESEGSVEGGRTTDQDAVISEEVPRVRSSSRLGRKGLRCDGRVLDSYDIDEPAPPRPRRGSNARKLTPLSADRIDVVCRILRKDGILTIRDLILRLYIRKIGRPAAMSFVTYLRTHQNLFDFYPYNGDVFVTLQEMRAVLPEYPVPITTFNVREFKKILSQASDGRLGLEALIRRIQERSRATPDYNSLINFLYEMDRSFDVQELIARSLPTLKNGEEIVASTLAFLRQKGPRARAPIRELVRFLVAEGVLQQRNGLVEELIELFEFWYLHLIRVLETRPSNRRTGKGKIFVKVETVDVMAVLRVLRDIRTSECLEVILQLVHHETGSQDLTLAELRDFVKNARPMRLYCQCLNVTNEDGSKDFRVLTGEKSLAKRIRLGFPLALEILDEHRTGRMIFTDLIRKLARRYHWKNLVRKNRKQMLEVFELNPLFAFSRVIILKETKKKSSPPNPSPSQQGSSVRRRHGRSKSGTRGE